MNGINKSIKINKTKKFQKFRTDFTTHLLPLPDLFPFPIHLAKRKGT